MYIFAIGSISAGIEGIQHPERWEEGGEEYNPSNPDQEPPGISNVVIGVLLPASYFGYNKIRRDRSLSHIINKYNNLYSNEEIEHLKIPHNFIDNILNSNNWDKSVSIGFLSEKIPMSFIEASIMYDLNEKSEFYGAFTSFIFGGGLGLGYKYYFINKYKSTSTSYISTSLYAIGGGDDYQSWTGISIAPGFSLSLPDWENISINLGLNFAYMSDNSYGFLPFLNIESKF